MRLRLPLDSETLLESRRDQPTSQTGVNWWSATRDRFKFETYDNTADLLCWMNVSVSLRCARNQCAGTSARDAAEVRSHPPAAVPVSEEENSDFYGNGHIFTLWLFGH